jgi:hypothetical protein
MRTFITFLSLMTTLTVVPASAADFLLRGSPGQDDRNFILIFGKIAPGDDQKFKAVLSEALQKRTFVDTVVIYSPGGAVGPALQIGRYIRTLRTQTYGPYVTEPYFIGTQFCPVYSKNPREYFVMEYNWKTKRGDGRCICASACFLIWAGGIWGVGNTGTLNEKILIHRIAFDATEYAGLSEAEAKTRYEAAQRSVEVYLKEMGVPDFTIQRMFTIPSGRTEHLTKEEQSVLKQTPAFLGELVAARCGDSAKCFEQTRRQRFFEGAQKILGGLEDKPREQPREAADKLFKSCLLVTEQSELFYSIPSCVYKDKKYFPDGRIESVE